MPQEIEHLGNQPLQGDKLDLQFLPARKRQQPRGQRGAAFRALDGPVQQSGYPRIIGNGFLQQTEAAQI